MLKTTVSKIKLVFETVFISLNAVKSQAQDIKAALLNRFISQSNINSQRIHIPSTDFKMCFGQPTILEMRQSRADQTAGNILPTPFGTYKDIFGKPDLSSRFLIFRLIPEESHIPSKFSAIERDRK